MGHALGIRGHSPAQDLMNAYEEFQGLVLFDQSACLPVIDDPSILITERDRNTLNDAYCR
jgi:predicted Zn-dependent protease